MTVNDEIESSMSIYNCIAEYGLSKAMGKIAIELKMKVVPRVVGVCKGVKTPILNNDDSNCLVLMITRNAYPGSRKLVQAMFLLDEKQKTGFVGFRMGFEINVKENGTLIGKPNVWIGLYDEDRPVMEWM